MELVDGWQDGEEGAKLAMILEQARIDRRVGGEKPLLHSMHSTLLASAWMYSMCSRSQVKGVQAVLGG